MQRRKQSLGTETVKYYWNTVILTQGCVSASKDKSPNGTESLETDSHIFSHLLCSRCTSAILWINGGLFNK